MSRLSAEEARKIAQAKDPSAAIEKILTAVTAAANQGKFKIHVRDHGFGDGACYTQESKWPAHCQAIMKELRALGYTCTQGSNCGQFVDLWLEVSW